MQTQKELFFKIAHGFTVYKFRRGNIMQMFQRKTRFSHVFSSFEIFAYLDCTFLGYSYSIDHIYIYELLLKCVPSASF